MLGNLADLVATGIASEPTLRKWLKDQHDCDWLKKRGSNGDAYEIDISGAIGAWKAKEADKVEAERAKGVILGQMAIDFGLAPPSEPTLRKWLKDQHDCDWLKKRGSNGDAYEIDISGAIGAWKAKEADKVEAERAKGVILGQMAIDFGLAPPSEPTLTIAERRALIDEEIAALKLGQLRRALVPVASVDAAFADILARYAQRASTFAARLAKKIDLSREQIVAIEMLRAADQSWFADQMENWGRDIVDGNDDSGSPLEASAPDDGR